MQVLLLHLWGGRMKPQEIEKLRIKYESWCQDHKLDSDLFDFDAELDRTLDYFEAWNEIEEKIMILAENGTIMDNQYKKIKAEEEKEKQEKTKINSNLDVRRILQNNLSILMSRTNEAKTSFLCEITC